MKASTDRLSGWQIWRANSRPGRAALAYVCVTLAISALALVLTWTIAPEVGLSRAFYPDADFARPPLFQSRTTQIDLTFLDAHPEVSRQSFAVRWAGFRFVPRQGSVTLSARGDDRVEIYLDRLLVLKQDAVTGGGPATRRVTLAAGPHEIIVRYEQDEGAFSLMVLRGRSGEALAPFRHDRLFPRRPGATDVWVASWRHRLNRIVAVLWLGPALALLALAVRSEMRAWDPPAPRELVRRMSRLVLPALLGPVVVFLAGPHTIYQGNRAEFSVPFSSIAWPWLLAAVAVAWIALVAVGGVISLLSRRVHRAYLALLVAVGVLLWVQGTLLVADYGPLYGEGLDLSRFAWRTPYEAALWTAGALLALVFARAFSNAAPLVSGVFVALQVAALALPTAGVAARESPAAVWNQPPPRLFQLSRARNVIHVVLDGFLSEIFAETIRRDRAGIDRDFSGFVFFADHLGAFPTTRGSMPAMLTGVAYRNDRPFEQYLRGTLYRQSLATALGCSPGRAPPRRFPLST